VHQKSKNTRGGGKNPKILGLGERDKWQAGEVFSFVPFRNLKSRGKKCNSFTEWKRGEDLWRRGGIAFARKPEGEKETNAAEKWGLQNKFFDSLFSIMAGRGLTNMLGREGGAEGRGKRSWELKNPGADFGLPKTEA